ncbi:hypothetical protein A0H81_14901 [Grifola frondosa]|uniref:Protein kinase domain-containing protein n=1 Tax=Grifola frondosa TaxID=5627 RepID=A0A1C7LKN0_GRIFR|nr:hypothetical protein A0H81_14901 [Grifola frondosa]
MSSDNVLFEKFVWGEAELAALDARNFKRNSGGKLASCNIWTVECATLILCIKGLQKSAVPKKSGDEEARCIEKLLRTPSPRNHTIPAELVECPDSYLIFMSFLAPSDMIYTKPLSVLLDFTEQILEGIQFMQEQHIAFVDVAPSNVVYAPHEPIGFGLLKAMPGRFYFIDFGSAHLLPGGPGGGLVITDYKTYGGHYDPPESEDRVDPYAYDVLQRLKKEDKIYVPSALLDYIDILTAPIPEHRPSIQRATRLFIVLRIWMLCTNWLQRVLKHAHVDWFTLQGWRLIQCFI